MGLQKRGGGKGGGEGGQQVERREVYIGEELGVSMGSEEDKNGISCVTKFSKIHKNILAEMLETTLVLNFVHLFI